MRAFQQHPDLIPVVMSFFGDNLPSYHVAGDLTGWEKGDIWITVQPTGGTISKIRTGAPQFDVNVYAGSKPQAFDVAMQTVKTFMQMLNYTYEDAVITDVECSYPADISDPLNSTPRYVFDVVLRYRTN